MAGYPYYSPAFQPYLSNYSPLMAPSPAPAQPQPQPQPQPSGSGAVWVQGENGAKAYLVAPNTTVLLMDSETNRFYLKASDASGIPQPLRVFEYTEIKPGNINGETRTDDKREYALKSDLEALRRDFDALMKTKGDGDE